MFRPFCQIPDKLTTLDCYKWLPKRIREDLNPSDLDFCKDFFCTLMVSNWWRKGYNKYRGVRPVITVTVLAKGEPCDSDFDPFHMCVQCTFRFCSFP